MPTQPPQQPLLQVRLQPKLSFSFLCSAFRCTCRSYSGCGSQFPRQYSARFCCFSFSISDHSSRWYTARHPACFTRRHCRASAVGKPWICSPERSTRHVGERLCCSLQHQQHSFRFGDTTTCLSCVSDQPSIIFLMWLLLQGQYLLILPVSLPFVPIGRVVALLPVPPSKLLRLHLASHPPFCSPAGPPGMNQYTEPASDYFSTLQLLEPALKPNVRNLVSSFVTLICAGWPST